jgi:hypothetical protein
LPTFFAAAKKVGAAPHSNALNLSLKELVNEALPL